MTEQVTEATESEATPAAELKFPDEMARMSFNMLSQQINERNAQVGKINAVKGDRLELQKNLEENSDNPEAAAARKRRDEAQAIVDQAVMDLHKVVQAEVEQVLANAESSVKEIEEKVKELDGIIKPGTTYFRKSYGDDLAKALPGLARLKGFTTKGAGSTGRRVRGFEVAVEIDGEVQGFDNLAGAAKFLDLETAQLQEAFFKAAGVDELKKAPDTVQFTVDYTETYDDDTTENKTAIVICERVKKDEAPEAETEDDEDATESE